jgi:hypothetical protein
MAFSKEEEYGDKRMSAFINSGMDEGKKEKEAEKSAA